MCTWPNSAQNVIPQKTSSTECWLKVEFSISLFSQVCVYTLVRFRHRYHLVRVQKTTVVKEIVRFKPSSKYPHVIWKEALVLLDCSVACYVWYKCESWTYDICGLQKRWPLTLHFLDHFNLLLLPPSVKNKECSFDTQHILFLVQLHPV